MAALNFPTTPTIGDQYNDWVWDGDKWNFAQTLPGGLPAGSIIPWGGANAPVNWLLCDGSAVSRTTYPSLFAVVGTSYGSGDGSTTFNLPDLRGRVPVGRDGSQTEFDVLGETGGAKTHTLTVAEMPSHSHPAAYYDGPEGTPIANRARLVAGISLVTDTARIGNTGGGQAHNNLQPYQVVNYIIKATAAVTPGESELAPRVGALEAVNSGSRLTSVESVNTTQDSRLTAIETADSSTNRSGLVPVLATSLTAVGGSASINSVGQVTATGVSSIALNEVFSSNYRNYRIHIHLGNTSGATNLFITPRSGTTDVANALYYQSNTSIQGGGTGNSHSTNVNFWHITGFTAASGTPFYTMFTGDIFGPQRSDARTVFAGQGMGIVSAAWETRNVAGWDDTLRSSDGIRVWSQGGQTFTAVVSVYGYRS